MASLAAASRVSQWGTPADVFTRLAGNWTLHRRADGRDLMTGQASLTPNNDGSLAYRETGMARYADGQSFAAERTYLYRAGPSGFSVFFSENPPRLFHDVILNDANGTLTGEASHLCRDDLYRSRYSFLPDGTFSTRHDVRGPRKNYVLDTSYSRIGG